MVVVDVLETSTVLPLTVKVEFWVTVPLDIMMDPVAGLTVVILITPSTPLPLALKGVDIKLKLAVSTPACCSQPSATFCTTVLITLTSVGVGGGFVAGLLNAVPTEAPCTLYQVRMIISVSGVMLMVVVALASALTL
ncbi:MAG: hypothetical protein M0Z89_11035 [Nitrospiraceae bacterium]|nr:hypothetical protein [Nitrospiraceae bacterium]